MERDYLQKKDQSIATGEKFRLANLARCIYTLGMIFVFLPFQIPWIIWIGSIHFFFSVCWFLLIEFEILIESNVWWSGYIPASFDLFWLTVLAHGTGNISSFFILGYIGSIALSSMSIDRNYGIYNAILATVLFCSMGVLVHFNFLPVVNIFMEPVKPSILGIIISTTLLGASSLIINRIISNLFFSLTDVNKQLLFLAMTDPLTGLANRRAFFQSLELELARKNRSLSSYPISFVLFDLDHFKSINDIYGHEIGDQVLVKFAKICRSLLRKQDIIARWGGEEFMALLPDTDLAGAIVVGEKIRNTISRESVPIGPKTLSFTVSGGISILRDVKEDPDKNLKEADHFLYQAKRRGRNQICSEKDSHGPL